MKAFSHCAGTVADVQDSLKSCSSVFFALGPRCLSMSLQMPSGPGAFIHLRFRRAVSSSFRRKGADMQLSGVSPVGNCFSSSLTAFVLSLRSLTVLSSRYIVARVLAAFFPVCISLLTSRTVCLLSGMSSFSVRVSYHSFLVSLSMLSDWVFSCQLVRCCWSLSLVYSVRAWLWSATLTSDGFSSMASVAVHIVLGTC